MFKANIDNSSRQELLSCCFCDHVSPNINKLWLLLCYVRVRFQLASPPVFHFNTHPEGQPCTMYKCILWPFGIFFSSGRGSFLILSAPWHAESPPEHQGARVGPGRYPWHGLWGFKVARPHGEAFRARRAI